MTYKSIGENIWELKLIPAEQRRAVFRRAARKTFLNFYAWAGVFLLVVLSYCGLEYAESIERALRKFFQILKETKTSSPWHWVMRDC